jgi:hypothetical protein
MARFRFVCLITLMMLCRLVLTAVQSKDAGSDADAIRIGVAVLKNTATRSVPLTIERDRLVSSINRMKPPNHSHDKRKLRAVALESSVREEANAQARDLGCDYVVFTDLVELRESGDPAPIPRPGEIRLGRDPVANDPPVSERQETQRYAVLEFRLYRMGDPEPRVESSVSDHQATTEDGIVALLMNRVASRVANEIFSGKGQ